MEMLIIESPPSRILDVSDNQGCNIYMKIYLAYEEHVHKTPTQYNVSMANALKRCTDGRR